MLSLWVVNAMFAVQAAATLTPDTSSTSNCTESPQDDTISFFSHAPLTFSFDVPSALLCATKCADVSPCRAWLYSSSGQECQLYRQQPLFQAHNPLFVSGICGRSSVLPSAIPFPSISTPAASSHGLVCTFFFFYSFFYYI